MLPPLVSAALNQPGSSSLGLQSMGAPSGGTPSLGDMGLGSIGGSSGASGLSSLGGLDTGTANPLQGMSSNDGSGQTGGANEEMSKLLNQFALMLVSLLEKVLQASQQNNGSGLEGQSAGGGSSSPVQGMSAPSGGSGGTSDAGGGSGGSSGASGDTSSGGPGKGGTASEKDAIKYFEGQDNGAGGKWTHKQAAGIVANLKKESGLRANAKGDGGQAYGIGQWHPDRQKNYADYAKANGLNPDIHKASVKDQLGFVNWELTKGTEKAAGAKLRSKTSAYDAGAAVSQFYERPGDVQGEMAKRGKYADQIA